MLDDHRFTRTDRLTSKVDFKRVLDHNTRYFQQGLIVLVHPELRNFPRLGIIVSKKSIRKAADRNRVKRLIRESFRQHKQEMTKADMVVIALKQAEQLNNEELFFSLKRHWRKIK